LSRKYFESRSKIPRVVLRPIARPGNNRLDYDNEVNNGNIGAILPINRNIHYYLTMRQNHKLKKAQK